MKTESILPAVCAMAYGALLCCTASERPIDRPLETQRFRFHVAPRLSYIPYRSCSSRFWLDDADNHDVITCRPIAMTTWLYRVTFADLRFVNKLSVQMNTAGALWCSGSKGRGFESEHRLFSHYSASAFSKLRSLTLCSLDTIQFVACYIVHTASYPPGKANRVAACQW